MKNRADGENWTPDPFLTKEVLYRWATSACVVHLSGRRGSNPPPKAWKAFALPNELLPLDLWGKVDSNHRTDTRTDLQSVAIATMRLPLDNSEPVDGLEPPTGWLQISYSTNWVIPASCKRTFFASFCRLFFAKRCAKIDTFLEMAMHFLHFFWKKIDVIF